MAQIKRKGVDLTDNTDALNGRSVSAYYTPTNYTPTEVASEGTNKISAHLNGINEALATNSGSIYDLPSTSFSLSNNQAAFANITGFSFPNANVRSFKAIVSTLIDATTDLAEEFTIDAIQKPSGWDFSVSTVGDNSGVDFNITSLGQVQYTSQNYSGFVSGELKFRAWVTEI